MIKDLTATALALLPSITAMIGAVMLAYNDCKGWGWLIIAAIAVYPNIKLD